MCHIIFSEVKKVYDSFNQPMRLTVELFFKKKILAHSAKRDPRLCLYLGNSLLHKRKEGVWAGN